jgi:hypothetical protein
VAKKRSEQREIAIRNFLGNLLLSALVLSVAAGMLWLLAGISPILTMAGGITWSAIAQIVTFDEERPGGARNPEGSTMAWRLARAELALKLTGLFALLLIGLAWPETLGLSAAF